MYEFLPAALSDLKSERELVNEAITALEQYAMAGTTARQTAASLDLSKPKRGRPPMTKAQRKAQSERMKAYWESRRAETE